VKVVAKPIDVVVWVSKEGELNPVRFRYAEKDDSYRTIKIDRVIHKEVEKFAGNNMMVFRCYSNINGAQRAYEIKYEFNTCKWMLFKI
jgi:hypothetical protein